MKKKMKMMVNNEDNTTGKEMKKIKNKHKKK